MTHPLPVAMHPAPALHPWRPGAVLGGFECATHRRRDGRRIDSIAATRHDVFAPVDYAAAAEAGFTCMRDGLRWHLIEAAPGRYDWSSAQAQIDAAARCGIGVIWDLCHWGWPEHIDIWSATFVERFVAFTVAAIERLRASGGRIAGLVPINEISFWAWAGGEHPRFAPYGRGEGDRFKAHLVSCWLAAVRAIRAIDPAILVITSEPLVVVHPNPRRARPHQVKAAQDGMYEAWDMLLGRSAQHLGGHDAAFDVMGLNWYPENQWRHFGRMLARNDPRRLKLRTLLTGLSDRYNKPMMLTETGQEEPGGAAWLAEVVAECRAAEAHGADLRGICIYPAMDYPGWDNGRHCPCGPIALDPAWSHRRLRADLVHAVQQVNCVPAPATAAVA